MNSVENTTVRATVKELEEIISMPLKVLDKGEIRLIEYMGCDQTIVNAARVSYGQGTVRTRTDEALINYLLKNKHTSPFEMCELVLYIKLPIFVAAQWIRHRTANVNASSARYSVFTDEFYIPKQLKSQSITNKQCSGDVMENSSHLIEQIQQHCSKTYKLYENLLEKGVSRELARMILPQNIYTQWYWKIDLHNLLHFVRLRIHSHAQQEIREYALVILEQIIKKWVPSTYQAFMQHVKGSLSLSQQGQKAIRDKIQGSLKERENYNIGKGEWEEIMNLIANR